MNKKVNNFNETTYSDIKAIKVTDELKSQILKKHIEEKKNNIRSIFITAASTLIIAFSVFSYTFVLNNPRLAHNNNKEATDKSVSLNALNNNAWNENNMNTQNKLKNSSVSSENEPKNTPQKNNYGNAIKDNKNEQKVNTPINSKLVDSTKNDALNKTEETKSSSNLPEINAIDITSENLVLNNNADKNKDTNIDNALKSGVPSAKASLESPKSTSIADAEKFWGGKILLPSYIPNGLELTDISIPKNNPKEICVKLNYSFKNTYFKIVENKSTAHTSYVGTSIDLNGSKAYVSKGKDANNSNLTIIEINWMNNNIQYTIIGNLSEEELIKILKSLN